MRSRRRSTLRRSTPARSGARPPRRRARPRTRSAHRCRRVPRRPRGVRGRRPARHARLSRVLGAGRPGGAELLRDRAGTIGSDLVSTSRRRPRSGRACRWRSTTRASPSSASRCSSTASAAASSTTPRRPRAAGVDVDRARPARPEPVGSVPAQHGHVARDGVARDELIAGLDRGLLVTRFHYTNPVHPKLAIITGMTRDGTFLVEGGRIVGPVRNLRFTQSYLEALGVYSRGRPRAQDTQGLPRRRGRPGDPARRLDLHGDDGTLMSALAGDFWVCARCRSINNARREAVLQLPDAHETSRPSTPRRSSPPATARSGRSSCRRVPPVARHGRCSRRSCIVAIAGIEVVRHGRRGQRCIAPDPRGDRGHPEAAPLCRDASGSWRSASRRWP